MHVILTDNPSAYGTIIQLLSSGITSYETGHMTNEQDHVTHQCVRGKDDLSVKVVSWRHFFISL